MWKILKFVSAKHNIFNKMVFGINVPLLQIHQYHCFQSLSHIWLLVTPWIVAHQVSLSITVSWILLKLMSIESMMSTNHLIIWLPLVFLPLMFLSISAFSSELVLCIRWPNYWTFSFSISPSTEYLELISFRFDWLDLLAVPVTLKYLLQYHCLKA